MWKKLLFILLFVVELFSSSIYEMKGNTQTFKDVPKGSVKRYVQELEKTGVHSPVEYVMLGITYEFGIKDEGIKKNIKKAEKYYRLAYKNKITYGGIRLALLLLQKEKVNDAEKILENMYFSNDFQEEMSYKEKSIILSILKKIAKDEKKFDKEFFYLNESVKNFKNDKDALKLFYIKYYGLNGIIQDNKDAEYYLNIACQNVKSQEVYNFCSSSPLIIKEKKNGSK